MSSAAEAWKSSPQEVGTPSVTERPRKNIWAIGGGKGGVGKSFVSSSIAITLARMGHSVVIIDLDLGGANLHTCLGYEIPPKSLSDYLSGRVTDLSDLVIESHVKNLKFISGANDALNIANLRGGKRERLIGAIRDLNFDYVILDLGAGTTDNTLDFFLMADKCLITFVPEPTSIENAYRFIKSAFYRKLKSAETMYGLKGIVDEAMDHKNQKGIRSPSDLIQYVTQKDSKLGQQFRDEIRKFKLYFIMNQVRTRSDVDVGLSVQTVCRRYFGIETEYAGYLDFDNAVWQSLRRKKPLLIEFPYSLLVGQFTKICKYLVDPIKNRSML